MAGPQLGRDEAGNIWELDAQGNPVRLHTSSPMNSPFADPRLQYQVQSAAGAAGAAPYEAPKAQAEAATAQAQASVAAPKAQTDLDIARANLAKTEAETKQLQTGKMLDPAVRQKALQDYSFSDQLQGVIDNLRTAYAAGPGKTKGVMGSADYLPLTRNQEFDSAANAARGIIGQALGFTGGQLNTEHESEMNIGPFLPHSSDRDAVIEDKLARLQALADAGRQRAVQTLGGEPDAQGNVHPVTPAPAPAVVPPSADNMQLNGGAKTRAQIDPMLRAVGGKVGSMLAAGVGDQKIRDYLTQSGVDPAKTNLDRALQFRRSPDFKTWQRANPGKPYPIGPDFYTNQVPVSDTRRLFNAAANTDLGGAAAAATVAAGNAIAGDRGASLIGSINGDPQMAQTGMDLLRQNHQLASLGGDIAGQVLLEASLARIPGAQGLLATRWGRRGADALYGAYSGSGDDSGGDAATGGIVGGLVNAGGGMFGRGVQKAVGRTLSGVKNPALQYLDNQGVPLTIGQIGHGSDNVVGHIVGGLEDRFAGLPGFDAVINTARQRGETAFNRAAFKQAGGTGATGAAGLAELNQNLGNAYGFLNGTSIPIDAQFAGRNAAVRAAIPDMPGFGNEVGSTLNQIDKVSAPGAIAGRDWQSLISDVRGDRSSIAGKPFASGAVKGMKDVENNLLELADRQGPAGTLENLNGANRLNTQTQTIASALDKGPVQRNGQMFSPQNLDDASRVNTRKFGGRMASLTGANRPFYELSQAGLDVMPNLTPDSGTAGRMWLVPLATSAIGGSVGAATGGNDKIGNGELGSEYGALLGLSAMGLYSKAGQKIIQKALLGDRPDRFVRVGDYLMRNPKYAGMFGSGLSRDYLYNLAQ